MKKQGARFNTDRNLQNPCFALLAEGRNALAVNERTSIDALLEHRASADDVGTLKTMFETAIRAIRISHKEAAYLYEPGSLAEAQRIVMRAASALHAAERRMDTAGVYGLDAAGRQHIIAADQTIADCRKPGRITRRVWLLAFRESIRNRAGILIPPTEEAIELCTL